MTYAGWASFAGVEIINDARAAAYALAAGFTLPCNDDAPALTAALGDAAYTTAAGDVAPWYDPAVPASSAVLGFIGLEVTGLDKGTFTRDVAALVGDGASLGLMRRGHREPHYRVAAVATGVAAASWAITWLNGVMRGSVCDLAAVGGDALCVFSTAPATDGNAEARTVYEVGVIDSPGVVDQYVIGADCTGQPIYAVEIEFTLAAGRPYLYRPAVSIAAGVILAPAQDLSAPVPDVSLCVAPGDCAVDPLNPPPAPPPAPPIPVDPSACVYQAFPRRQTLVVPGGLVPEVLEKVPYVRVYSGATGMRCLTVRWYVNPAGAACSRIMADPCSACAEINLPYLPANSWLHVDGRIERAWLECPGSGGQFGATTPAILFGPAGRPWGWPVFECALPMCLEVASDANTSVAADAAVWLDMYPREDAL